MNGGDGVLWEGQPDTRFYTFAAVPVSIFGILWLIIPTWFAVMLSLGEGGSARERLFIGVILLPFFAIGIYAVAYPVLRYFERHKVRYVVTERHIALTGGVIVPRTRRIPVENVLSLEVRMGLYGFLKELGEVEISTGEFNGARMRRYTLVGVRDPEDIAAMIEDLMAQRRERAR